MTIYPSSHWGNGVLAEPSMAYQLAHHLARCLARQLAILPCALLMHVQVALHSGADPGAGDYLMILKK